MAPLRLGTALAAVLLVVSACGQDDPPEGPVGGGSSSSPSDSTSASPSESPSTSAQPPVVPSAAKDDAKGREAFVRWFADAFAYAFATNDPTPINDVAATDPAVECGTCQLFTTFLKQRRSDGNTVVEPSAYTVRKVFPTGRDRGAWIYTMVTKRPAYSDVKDDGTVVDKFPADPAYLIEVGLRWHDGAYELTGWTAGKKKDS